MCRRILHFQVIYWDFQMHSKQHYLKLCGPGCVIICSFKRSVVSDLLATTATLCPVCHSHAPFMGKRSLINWRECPLPTRSCLEEQKAECLSRPDFCPADGVLVLLLPHILSRSLIKNSSFIPISNSRSAFSPKLLFHVRVSQFSHKNKLSLH